MKSRFNAAAYGLSAILELPAAVPTHARKAAAGSGNNAIRLARSLLTAAGCWLLAITSASAQPEINPTGDPKLAATRVLALDAGGHTGGVYRLVLNGYGDQLISVSYDKTIRIWDLQTGEPLRVLRPPIDRGGHGVLASASLHPDGDLLAVSGYRALSPIYDHRIRLISLASGETVRLLKGHFYSVDEIAFSPDGKRLASASMDSTARIWDVETGETQHVLKGHTNILYRVAWSADGKRVVTASADGTARIWNTSTGATEVVLPGHQGQVRAAAWSPDGRTVATGCDDLTVRLFEPDGKLRYSWPARPNQITSMSFSPDSSRLLYTYSSNGANVPLGAGVLSLVDGRELSRFTGHANGAIACTFLRDSKTAVTGDSIGGICIWDSDTGRLVRRLESLGRSKFAVGWSPDGQQVAWGNLNEYSTVTELAPLQRTFSLATLDFGWPPQGNYIRAQFNWGQHQITPQPPRSATVMRGGGVLSTLTMPDPNDQLRSWSLLSDNRAALGGNTLIYLYDVNTGQLSGELADNCELNWSMAPSPDSRYLLSGGADQTLRIWKPDSNELLLSLFVAGDEWIAWTPQGYYAASLGGENLMGWHINNGLERMASFYPAARFHNSLYRPDVISRLLPAGSLQTAHAQADAVAVKVTKQVVLQTALPPVVKVVIRPGSKSESSTMEVQATATPAGDSPITSLQLLVDGRPSGPSQPVEVAAGGKPIALEHSWKLELPPGEHRVSVRADTDKSYGLGDAAATVAASGKSSAQAPGSSAPGSSALGKPRPAKSAPGNLYILSVGISAYEEAGLRLPLATADARAVAESLAARGRPLFGKVEVQVLTDAQATRTALLQALTLLQGEMTLADTAVVFLSVRAEQDDQQLPQLLAVNATAATAGPAVAMSELKQIFGATRGKIVLLLDAHPTSHAPGARPDEHVRGPVDPLIRSLLADDCGVVVLTSASRRELPLDIAIAGRGAAPGQGAFAQALLEALAGSADTNQDGTVHLHELGSFVVDRVPALTQDRQHATFRLPALVRSFPLVRESKTP
ncbi:MAG TPA: WD40 repeat domain-containing protein [Pirellulales bacterium]|nr:WD40 repeat domain-containing protein [Pirellulales bacterium]